MITQHFKPEPFEDDNTFIQVIHRYTHAQALEDGVLFDVSKEAKECGIPIPTSLTKDVYFQFVDGANQSTSKELRDILKALKTTINNYCGAGTNSIIFDLMLIPRDGYKHKAIQTTLEAAICYGDNQESVIVIKRPSLHH